MYGLTFARTVRTFPKTIFVVACAALVIAFVLVSCVRLPDYDHPTHIEEQPLVIAGDDEDVDGRRDTLVGVPEPLIVVEDADGAGTKVVKP